MALFVHCNLCHMFCNAEIPEIGFFHWTTIHIYNVHRIASPTQNLCIFFHYNILNNPHRAQSAHSYVDHTRACCVIVSCEKKNGVDSTTREIKPQRSISTRILTSEPACSYINGRNQVGSGSYRVDSSVWIVQQKSLISWYFIFARSHWKSQFAKCTKWTSVW